MPSVHLIFAARSRWLYTILHDVSCGFVSNSWSMFDIYSSIFRSSPGDNLVDWNSGVSFYPYVRLYIRTSTKSFPDFDLIWYVGRPRPRMHTSVTSTDLRPRSRSFRSCENCTFLGLSPPPFWRGAQNWWLVVIVWDRDYSFSETVFWISF